MISISSFALLAMVAAVLLTTFHRMLCSLPRFRRRRKRKQHFKSATTGVATKNMRNELNRLVNTVADPQTRKVRDCLSVQITSRFLTRHGRRSIPRCSPSSISSPVTLPRRHPARNCACSASSLVCLRAHLILIASVWDRIKSPAAEQIVPYDDLPTSTDPKTLDKLAVLKVNGGLGTSMGTSLLRDNYSSC